MEPCVTPLKADRKEWTVIAVILDENPLQLRFAEAGKMIGLIELSGKFPQNKIYHYFYTPVTLSG